MTFKTTSEDFYSSNDESSDEDEECMTMIARGLKKIFKSKRFDPKKFYKSEQRGMKDLQKVDNALITMNLIWFHYLAVNC